MFAEFLSGVLAELVAKAGEFMFGVVTAPEPLGAALVTSESYALLDESGQSIVGVLTRSQLDDIHSFLSTREVATLVQALLLSGADKGDRHGAYSADLIEFGAAFEKLACLWCETSGQHWASLAGDIWVDLSHFYESAFLSSNVLAGLSRKDRIQLQSYMAQPEQLQGNEPPVPIFVRELMEITASQDRLIATRNRVGDLRDALVASFSRMRLRHAQEDYRFDYDRLYIDRNLTLREDRTVAKSEDVLDILNHRVRSIIIGDPGVGKSTLVEHLIHTTTREAYSPSVIAPLLLRCRDYAAQRGRISLVEALRLTIGHDLQLDISSVELTDILSLGRALVIFDGVDEIIDIGSRREFISQAEAFASRFPFVSIVATSRRVGYERASFDEDLFDVYELQEYSQAQVHQYADRWFRATERPQEDRDAFLRESLKIDDIRTNPLMLSLLCTLYRARGYIPRNRRDVYRECAELLFHRWDSLRHIEQPIDHQQYGQHLMQELAFFFFQTQTAQAGVEEQQLRRIIENFFIDTAGVFREVAVARARDFLDFCADRAWLLTSKGTNDRGQRIFTFTHKTFMEYFSAEVLVRRSNTLDEIAETVLNAFNRDSSSVLPDIIVQCADDKFDRGAEQLIGKLVRANGSREKMLSLCLRLINSAPVSARAIDSLFSALFAYWANTDIDDTLESTIATMELYRDPRARFLRKIDNQPGTYATQLSARWLRLRQAGHSRPFEIDWGSHIDRLLEDISAEDAETGDPVIINYLFSKGLLGDPSELYSSGNIGPLLAYRAFDAVVGGPVLGSMFRALSGRERTGDLDLLKTFTKQVIPQISPVPESLAKLVGPAISADLTELEQTGISKSVISASRDTGKRMSPVLQLVLWISFIIYEAENRICSFHATPDQLLGRSKFRRIIVTRQSRMGKVVGRRVLQQIGSPYSRADFIQMFPVAPDWCIDWCLGARNLTSSERTPSRQDDR